jgi:autotransporter passenger strand-loop-strand repeat protein
LGTYVGGIDVLRRGGTAWDSLIAGTALVSSGSSEKAAGVYGRATMILSSGGTATSTIVGGVLQVLSGGVASATTVVGGTLTVSSGGAILGGLTLQGGEAVIAGTMGAGQTATFVGTFEVLELDNLPGFQAKISGLTGPTDKIDLGGFTFSSGGESVGWAQSGTSGTLTVTDGAKVAHLTLIGTYTSSSFNLSNDGHGGTFVADPPTPSAAGFAQALAGFSAPGPTITAPVTAGGTSGFAEMLHATASAGGRA